MTSLAGQGPVASLVVHFSNVWMADRALLVSRINERLSGVGFDSRGPVMANSAESLGHQEVSRAEQRSNQEQESNCQTSCLLAHYAAYPYSDSFSFQPRV